jgi:periplasmic divalent cation tolerance protein
VKPLIVYITTASRQEAETIADRLVEERLAACATIVDNVTSVYRWKESVERSTEVMIMVKTMSTRYRRLESRVQELHSYENPEIISVELYAGSRDYLIWLQEETS